MPYWALDRLESLTTWRAAERIEFNYWRQLIEVCPSALVMRAFIPFEFSTP